ASPGDARRLTPGLALAGGFVPPSSPRGVKKATPAKASEAEEGTSGTAEEGGPTKHSEAEERTDEAAGEAAGADGGAASPHEANVGDVTEGGGKEEQSSPVDAIAADDGGKESAGVPPLDSEKEDDAAGTPTAASETEDADVERNPDDVEDDVKRKPDDVEDAEPGDESGEAPKLEAAEAHEDETVDRNPQAAETEDLDQTPPSAGEEVPTAEGTTAGGPPGADRPDASPSGTPPPPDDPGLIVGPGAGGDGSPSRGSESSGSGSYVKVVLDEGTGES
ncbi:hypothetical protein THAOC_26909, partial [Thalassiosira oceanica]